jgi:hypothetical protein
LDKSAPGWLGCCQAVRMAMVSRLWARIARLTEDLESSPGEEAVAELRRGWENRGGDGPGG